MHRRDVLKFLAAISTLNLTTPVRAQTDMKVVVVGAGIVGSAIAYFLSRAGVQVEIIDRVGPASHASRATFAWINATWAKQPRTYHAFNQNSMNSWKTLEVELDIPILWEGSLEWFADSERTALLRNQIEEQALWGEDASMVRAEQLRNLEPNVVFGDQQVAYSENDGAVDPVLAVNMLLDGAKARGAIERFPCELQQVIRTENSIFLNTSTGAIQADAVVLATGADPDAMEEFAGMTVPQRSTPGVIAVTNPLPQLISRVIAAPGVHMHQMQDGRFIIGEQAGPPDTAAHNERLVGRPTEFPTESLAVEHGYRLLNAAAQVVPEIRGARLEWAEIGWRPLPLDGHPVIGRSTVNPRVYMAVMHSGVTLAPLAGQLATLELIENRELPELRNYRPDREFQLIRRY
ncbi:MAG: FAD-dependent oxidoreductase [Gammaproteobacteria bacterium]|nr:FAD-dependent oxidoreductase [Gammaproteobacteria bacterium]MDD9957412.1 FAD-dependent oxidoreductase [Gammaproteobacteria bacterium]